MPPPTHESSGTPGSDAPPQAEQAPLPERLALSRARLRQAMASNLALSEKSFSIRGAMRHWWSQNPTRIAGTLLGEPAKAFAYTMVQRNPIGIVLGALALGGLIVWFRPWRWFSVPAVFAGLLPQLAAKAMASVPSGPWMMVLTSLALALEQHKPSSPSPH